MAEDNKKQKISDYNRAKKIAKTDSQKREVGKSYGKSEEKRFYHKDNEQGTDKPKYKKTEEKAGYSKSTDKAQYKKTEDKARYNKSTDKPSYKKDGDKSDKKFYPKKPKSKCSISNKCGGCQYIDMPYEEQLKIKQLYVEKFVGEFCEVDPIIGMENPLHYRNKVHAVFHRMQNGTVYSGVYEEGTHNVLPVKKCFIENEKADEIIQTITGLLKSFKLTIYNENSGYGLMRHILIRTGHKSGEIMVVLVTAGPEFPSKNNFVKTILKSHPEITTIVQNINDKPTNMVLGTRDKVIYGKGYIEDTLCGKVFRISPQSFYQVNPVQTEVLYSKAVKLADLKNKETVIDAYCGIGTIGIIASKAAKEVIGVELNKEAVADAITNAKLNQIKNISFYNNDAGEFMVGLANEGKKVDVVFMDPPRSGSDEAFMSSVLQLAPKKIVYISCGPESLAEDLKYLTGTGAYVVKKIVPVDMFCYTNHVENVVLLTRV